MTPELLARLPVDLPAGALVAAEEGRGRDRPLWLSSVPASLGLWRCLHEAHVHTGVWPLLLDSYMPATENEPFRPWEDGELYPREVTSPDGHNAANLLAEWWGEYASETDTVGMGTSNLRDPWFFPAKSARPSASAAMAAGDAYAARYLAAHPRARLGLVAAESGAHALAAVGWQGPLNYDNDTGKFAAVVVSWQERFGARVVGVDGSSLDLSVAAPPMSHADALAVASEHYAFCPDNIWQGSDPYTIAAYAEQLVNASAWSFWWD